MCEWRTVQGFPAYEVSSSGVIRRRETHGKHKAGTVLNCSKLNNGYIGCKLRNGPQERSTTVHRIVAEAFYGPPTTPSHEVNHKNGIRDDNRASNLEWVTHAENMLHKTNTLRRGWKITADVAIAVRVAYAAKEGSFSELAKRFGLTKPHVGAIISRRCWATID